jgi:chromate reductase, NAD(P)H dehydrogenase (quinone)
MSDEPFRILGIAGSLRKASYNLGLLRAATQLIQSGVTLEIATLHEVPLYNADLQAAEGDPPSVVELKRKIVEADVVLFATPEYNYSIPGVLKNAIDWVSRPPKTCGIRKKPVGVIGASSGESGTMRSQLALRQVFVYLDAYAMVQPEFRLPRAGEKCDANGVLTDEEQKERLRVYLAALVDWARLVAPAG